MANPDVGLTLINDEKEVFNYHAQQGADGLSKRLNEIVGKGFLENFTKIELETSEGMISGFISTPTYNSGTSNEQYFFVNKRPVKDKLLSVAVKIAYQDFIPQGRYPMVYIFLELDSSSVDVNVHPAKAEVRFKDPNNVRNIVISAIKEGIREIGKQASDHLTTSALESFISEVPVKITNHEEVRNNYTARERQQTHFALRPSNPGFTRPSTAAIQIAQQMFKPSAPFVKAESLEFDQEQISFPLGSACGQIHDTYIISQTEDGMVLIDQHAAHERIFYESLKKEILEEDIKTQRLLIPEIVELPEHILEQLLLQSEELAKFGLHIEAFGSKAIAVSELPALLKCMDVKKLVQDIVDDLHEFTTQVSLEEKIKHFLATFACHHSIRAGRNLSIKEMNSLLREMEKCDHTGQCNHGRPTYIKLKMKDIEKLFERI